MVLIGRGARDAWVGLGITIFAGAIRLVNLGQPAREVFDEQFYARDGCWYVFRDAARCGLVGAPPEVHPPMGKWLLALGIRLFGFEPFGARILPWLAGVLAVALIFALAKRLTGRLAPAAVASLFLAIDPLHFVHSRLAHLDIFLVVFILAMFLLVVMASEKQGSGYFQLLLGGAIASGAALATKWTALPFCALAAVLAWRWHGPLSDRDRDPSRSDLTNNPYIAITTMTVVPLLVYVVSYIGRIEASVSAWFGVFWRQQTYMFDYLLKELPPHLYESKPWEWVIGQGPILYEFQILEGGFEEVLAAGNPLLYPLALAAVGFAAAAAYRSRGLDRFPTLIAMGFLVGVGPWVVIALFGRGHLFLYYLIPSLPFMALAVGYAFTFDSRLLKGLVSGLLILSGLLLAFLYPIIVSRRLAPPDWESRHLFHDVCPKETEPPGNNEDLEELLELACRPPVR